MKKFLFSVMAAAALFSTVSCSDDDDKSGASSSSVQINGADYVIKSNSLSQYYNITTREDIAAGRTLQTLMMFSGNDLENLKSLSVSVNFGTTAGINGTYSFAEEVDGNQNAAVITFADDNDKTWFSVPGQGQVKITSLGGEKYRIEFLNVVLSDLVSEATVSLTGTATTTFYYDDLPE